MIDREQLSTAVYAVASTVAETPQGEPCPEGHCYLALQIAYPSFDLEDWALVLRVLTNAKLVKQTRMHTLEWVGTPEQKAALTAAGSIPATEPATEPANED